MTNPRRNPPARYRLLAALVLLVALVVVVLFLIRDEGSWYTAARHFLRSLVRALF